jgi:hypothetical protein
MLQNKIMFEQITRERVVKALVDITFGWDSPEEARITKEEFLETNPAVHLTLSVSLSVSFS